MPKINIVIVEDEGIVALSLRKTLEGFGYHISGEASTGTEAVEMVANLRPDLILMDIKLGNNTDGVEATEQIHSRYDIPVVYLTAYSDEKTLERIKITEPYGYILKPFNEKELHSTIEISLYKHNMEKELKRREQWLSTTLKSIGDAVIATDKHGKVIFLNPIAETLTGWSTKKAIGRDLQDIFNVINEMTRETVENPVSKVLKEGVIVGLANHSILVTKTGKEIPIDDSAAPIQDTQGNIQGVVLVFKDITERKQAIEQLQRSEECFRAVVENSYTGIVIMDENFDVIYANDEIPKILGYSKDEITNHDFRTFFIGKNKERLEDYFLTRKKEKNVSGRNEIEIRRKDGKIAIIEWRLSNIQDRNDKSQIMIQILNITEKKKLEEQLRQAKKMEAIGTLAGGVAHDFNNILTAILGNTELAMTEMEKTDPLHKDLIEIHKSAAHAADLTRQLLYFSRKQAMMFESVDINKNIKSMYDMLNRLVGENIEISLDLIPNLWIVNADKGTFGQVIMNLIVNAREAIPHGGKITIKTENIVVNKPESLDMTDCDPGRYVRLVVEDTGVGMDDETIQRIFDPFFSTKGLPKGTGLGLSVVYGIVKQHNGRINVYSEPGHGTTFKIYLPAVSNAPVEKKQKNASLYPSKVKASAS